MLAETLVVYTGVSANMQFFCALGNSKSIIAKINVKSYNKYDNKIYVIKVGDLWNGFQMKCYTMAGLQLR